MNELTPIKVYKSIVRTSRHARMQVPEVMTIMNQTELGIYRVTGQLLYRQRSFNTIIIQGVL